MACSFINHNISTHYLLCKFKDPLYRIVSKRVTSSLVISGRSKVATNSSFPLSSPSFKISFTKGLIEAKTIRCEFTDPFLHCKRNDQKSNNFVFCTEIVQQHDGIYIYKSK